MTDKDEMRQAAIDHWWDDWYDADYSWDGLENIEWQGWLHVADQKTYQDYIKQHGLPAGVPNKDCQVIERSQIEALPKGTETRPATLQDYWRDQQGNLHPHKGEHYTIAHLPDKPRKKTTELKDLIQQRVNYGARTESDAFIIIGADRRSQFQGCVLPSIPSKAERADETTDLHLNCHQIAITTKPLFIVTIFGSMADFSKAQFSGRYIGFNRAQFLGGVADFGGAQFLDNTYFRSTQFSSEAYFTNSQFSGGNANFNDAQFSGDADFEKTEFSDNTTFRNVNFSSRAGFSHAQFKNHLSFSVAQFDKTAYFNNTLFLSTLGCQNAFSNTQFLGPLDFRRGNIDPIQDEDGQKIDPKKVFFPFNAFQHAKIKDGISLTAQGEAAAQDEFDDFMRALESELESRETNEVKKEQAYAAVEKSCMTLNI